MRLDRIIAVRSRKTVFRDGDYTAKVFDADYSKVSILNEAQNLAKVETTGLKVPELIGVIQVNGKWSIVSRYIPGKSLSRLMKEHPAESEAYLERMVRLQLQLHGTQCPLLNPLADVLQQKLLRAGLEPEETAALQLRLDGLERGTRVLHGDFCPSNVIITPEDEAYIIDWSCAAQGSPEADIARTYLVLLLQGNPELAEQYLNRICALGGIFRQRVQLWLPLVAAARASRGIPEEQALLRSFIRMAVQKD